MKSTRTEQPQHEANYKQLSKLRHLTDQHVHLKNLVTFLEQINYKSRQLLRGMDLKGRKTHMDSTACSIRFQNSQPSLMEDEVVEMEGLLASLDAQIYSKKREFEGQTRRQEREKIEDQILFRKMLYEYESKLASIKNQIKLRQECIQVVQKQQKDGKSSTCDQKVLGICYSSFKLFDEMCFVKEELKDTLTRTSVLESTIDETKQEIRSLERVVFKLKIAKEAKMPFYKFKDIVKNGFHQVSEEDKEDYAALFRHTQGMEDIQPCMSSRVAPQQKITPQMLYIIIRKEQLNRELLQKHIREEDQRQEQLQAQNLLLKEAIEMKKAQEEFHQTETRLREEEAQSRPKYDKALSEGSELKQPKLNQGSGRLGPSDYQLYIQKLGKKVGEMMSTCLWHSPPITLQKSKSERHLITTRQQDQEPSEIVTARFISEKALLDQCNDLITDRFYDETPEFEFVY